MFLELIGYLQLNWLEPDIYLQNNTVIKRLDLINSVRVLHSRMYFLNELCKLYEIFSLPYLVKY